MVTVTKLLEDNICTIKDESVKEFGQTPYDERLSTCNEPKFMKYIRNWEKTQGFVTPILWWNTFWLITLHFSFVLSLIYVIFIQPLKWETTVFSFLTSIAAALGIVVGVHRYWTHRSFKAKTPLRVILLIFFAMSGQNTIYEWVRDHRVHHKFSDSPADPHNAKRGFFFAHFGWLMMKKHPDVLREGNKIDMSDMDSDPLVRFHTRYYLIMKLLGWALPTMFVWLVIGETFVVSVITQLLLPHVSTLNITFSINSFAHLGVIKPYDPSIMPSDSRWLAILTIGEGSHNYHHTFPWDYKGNENCTIYNLSTTFINLMAKFGWAYDFKEASPSLLKAIRKREKGQ